MVAGAASAGLWKHDAALEMIIEAKDAMDEP